MNHTGITVVTHSGVYQKYAVIRAKLLKMNKEKLIEIIELLCDDKAAEKKLSLLVNCVKSKPGRK